MIKGRALRSTSGWATPEVEEGVRASAPALPGARRTAGAVSRALLARAFPHDSRQPARMPRPGRRADYAGRAGGQSGVSHGRASPGGRVARVHRRHGRVERASRARTGAAQPGRALGLHRHVWLRSGNARACDDQPSAVGVGLPGPRRPPGARDVGARPLAAAAHDARVRAGRHAGHSSVSRQRADALAIGDELVALCAEYELAPGSGMESSLPGIGDGGLGARRRDRPAERHARGPAIDECRSRAADVSRAAGRGALARGPHRRRTRGCRRRALARRADVSRAATWPSCIVCGDSCSSLPAIRPPPKTSLRPPSTTRAGNRRNRSSCERPPGWRVSCAGGRPRRRARRLAPVYEWFTEGHTTRDLVAARVTLSGIGT